MITKFELLAFMMVLILALLCWIAVQGEQRICQIQKLIDEKDSVIAAKSETIAKVALGLKGEE